MKRKEIEAIALGLSLLGFFVSLTISGLSIIPLGVAAILGYLVFFKKK